MSTSAAAEQLKRALIAVRDLRARLEEVERARREPIAVIGMACRFPGGADSPEAYWRLLEDGVDAVREVPVERWDAQGLYDVDPEKPNVIATRWAGLLDDVAGFEPEFFGISPREAEAMDPQQRLLLEVAHEALERAGLVPERLAGGSTGVFVGAHSHSADYADLQLVHPELMGPHTATGTAHSILANRISYWLDLRGPSLAVDTACSSSAVAIHLAVQSLRAGECSVALAGGVNLVLSPQSTMAFSRLRLFAADGRCKTFDASADGIVRSEGAGLVVLKRLSDARRDGDPVLAVIAGSAVNQDGRKNGLTAPNGLSQQDVLRAALENAGMDPARVTYVETHGTGTLLGDPIEAEALAEVLGRGDAPCYLGAGKTNIGHLEGAAGVAGLIKAVLVLQHRRIPPNLHFRTPNPHLRLDGTRLRIPTASTPWQGAQRVAGVSSFGFGGTNVHIVLEEAAPVTREAPHPAGPYLLPISAARAESLELLAEQYAQLLESEQQPAAAVCAAAALRRGHREHRLAVVGESADELAAALRRRSAEPDPDRATGRVGEDHSRRLVFLYSGQGGQHPEMALELLAREPVFRAAVEACDAAFVPLAGWSLLEELLHPETSGLDRTGVAQPLLFAMQAGLTELWRERGVRPHAIVGHSVGEVAAAWAAGALSLEDAVRVIYYRGHLVETMAGPGLMAVVGISREEVEALPEARLGGLSVAAVNGPRTTVISGEVEPMESALRTLEQRDVFVRRLFMAHPFHGPPMEPIRAELVKALQGIVPGAPQVPLYSSLTGRQVQGAVQDAAYWGRNLREPVIFVDALQQLPAAGTDFVEIGPHPVLGYAVEQVTAGAAKVLPSLHRDVPAARCLLRTMGALHVAGHALDWSALWPGPVPPVALPTHPWIRRPHWLGSGAPLSWTGSASAAPDAGAVDVPEHWLYDVAWQLRAVTGEALPRPAALALPAAPALPAASWPAPQLQDRLDAIAAAWVVKALHDLDWPLEPGARIADEDILRRQLPRPRQRLLHAMLAMLAADGVLVREERGWKVVAAPATLDPDTELRALRQQFPAHGPLLRLFGRCAPRLAAVIRGAQDPLDLLFPGGSGEDLRQLYGDSPVSRVANRAIAQLIESVAAGLPEGRGIRILELGGGTGATTAHLLPLLPRRRCEYVFTDVSRAFLEEAEAAFAQYPGFRTALLDIETDPAQQGFAPGSFDLVIAANVLHATADLGAALRHARSLLAAGGALALLEGTGNRRWVDLVFGVTDGWWRFDDVSLRSHALIGTDTWKPLLERCGFGDVCALELPEHRDGSGFDQVLLTARRTALDVPVLVAGGAGAGAWLVLAESPEDGRAAAQALHARGASVVVEDLASPASALSGWAAAVPAGRVLLVPTPPSAEGLGADAVLTAAADRHTTLVDAVQTLVELDRTERGARRLWVVTRGAQPAVPGDVPEPLGAAIWGLGRVVALEEPAIWGGLVDLDARVPFAAQAEALVAHLLGDDGEDQVALRGGDRFVARLAPNPAELGAPVRLRPDASYLVIGGLGRLGRLFAPWLARHGAGELVLVGRTPLPPEAEWDGLDADSENGKKIAAIRAARALGAVVTPLALDVTDADAVRRELLRLAASDRPLRGVLHAASFTEFVPSLGAERGPLEDTLRAKVSGTWVLHQLTQELGIELDHFVMFSSVASIFGSRAVGGYTAANQFLDALGHARRARGLPAFVVNWGGWAGGPASEAALLELNHLIGMPAAPAMTALGRLMNGSAVQRAVAQVDWTSLRRGFSPGRQRPFLDEIPEQAGVAEVRTAEAAAPAALAERVRTLPPAEARALVVQHVRATVGEVLGRDPESLLEPGQGFFKLGMDSLMTVELRGRLQRTLGLALPATIALEYPTVEALAEHLATGLGIATSAAADAATAEAALMALDEDQLASRLDAALADLLDMEAEQA